MGKILSSYIKIGSLTTTHWLAILFVLITGGIHVYAGFIEGRIPVSLAGVGFLGAAVLFLLDYRRSLLYIVGIVYTAVQFPLWYVANAGEFTTLGYVDKILKGRSSSFSRTSTGKHERPPTSIVKQLPLEYSNRLYSRPFRVGQYCARYAP